MNHSAIVISSLAYGQTPEKIMTRNASSFPPARQISPIDRAIENSKNFSIWNLSPAISASMLTVAPRERWPLKNNAMLSKRIKGIPNRNRSGISGLRNRDFVIVLTWLSTWSSSLCWTARRFSWWAGSFIIHRLCLLRTTNLTAKTAMVAQTSRATNKPARRIK